ncbi:MAG: AAA family ATPase [Deltaproteobacteria bacterium]|nr:AAA family ATPase [Deltaproteobacteria bacterium]
MYTEFYNLREKPFDLTPSPRFLYQGEAHREALALLKYGVLERKGFILLTGDVGTGKTTVVKALLASLGHGIRCVYISNPPLTKGDLFSYLASAAFKKRVRYSSKAAFILDFEAFLRERLRSKEVFLLIIDEAQHLSFQLLEEIRLISNMEISEERLVNVFLIGQPELIDKLKDPRCRSLLQRISVRHHIHPLNLEETREYIATRLKVAGVENPQRIFSKDVIDTIHRFSLGYPRIINVLADNALLLGYSRGKKKITSSMVRESYKDMRLEGAPFKEGHVEEEKPETLKAQEGQRRGTWKWVAVALAIGLLFGLWLIKEKEGSLFQLSDHLPARIISLLNLGDEKRVDNPPESRLGKGAVANAKITPKMEMPAKAPRKIDEPPVSPEPHKAGEDKSKSDVASEKNPIESSKYIIVKEGDTLLELAAQIYGRADEEILGLLKQHNPHIDDLDLIKVGEKVIFPPLRPHNQGKIYTVHVASFKPFKKARELFQELTEQGYVAYIIPAHNPEQGRVFRVTLGSFDSWSKGNAFAASILRRGISNYAQTIELEAK